MSATRDTGQQAALNGAPTREVNIGAASNAAGTSTGSPPRRLGLALAVIATAQLMVVLDETIVNVALPHIQNALRFSGSNLEWVVNRTRWPLAGCCCSAADPATYWGAAGSSSPASWSSRWPRCSAGSPPARRGAGRPGRAGRRRRVRRAHRLVADCGHLPRGPAAEPGDGRIRGDERGRRRGRPDRRRAAGQLRQLALGAVRERADRPDRGAARAAGAARVAAPAGQFDLPGAITGSLGLAVLVYGLSSAATSPSGVSHWGDTKVIASLAAAAVLLVAFGVIEVRSRNALVPIRVLRSRDRSGSYLIMLCAGAALFGMFFFLTLFLQNVWGYSALKTGVAYLPMVATIMAGSAVASQLVNRIGARPLLLAGAAVTTGGLFWMSRITEHSHYASGPLGPTVVTSAGLGLIFVPLSLLALAKVADHDAGVASSLLNTGQQVGGSIGLVILGTVAWTAVASSIHSQAAAAARHAPAHLPAAKAAALHKAVTDHALSAGFSKGYLVSAGIAALALIIAVIAIRPAGRTWPRSTRWRRQPTDRARTRSHTMKLTMFGTTGGTGKEIVVRPWQPATM